MLNHQAAANIHPGTILREDYLPDLEAMGVTRYRIAKLLRITQSQLDILLAGKRGVTANMALRLGKLFNQSPEMWLGLQNEYDIAIARLDYPDIEQIEPIDFGKATVADNTIASAA
jgi:antitoxin HigA-1